MRVYVGVDWDDKRVVCATVTDAADRPRKIAGARADLADVAELIGRVRSRHPDASEVHVVIEAGRTHWARVFHEAGTTVHVVDPKQALRFAESLADASYPPGRMSSRALMLPILLVFHFAPTAPWLTRAAMWCACGYPGCRTTLLERLGMRRDVARQEIAALLELDFDRLVLAHGEVIGSGGKEALRAAFGWLGVGG